MAEAERKPSDGAQNQSDPIKRFQAVYAEALVDAEVAKSMTDEPNWRRLYEERRESQRSHRTALAKRMRIHADTLEMHGFTEDDEKAVKEILKATCESRDADTVYQRDVIDKVAEPARRCEKIVEDARNAAYRDEQAAPLVNVGLHELMKAAIAKVQRVTFNHETGTIEIK